ncbi:hypothetical protein JCM10450v2_000116 [Rhodotorula kratochvilovae]
MYGGSASSGGRWSLGAKTFRAPTEQERVREAQDRLSRENERRKLQEIKHEEKHIRRQRDLQREAARVNSHALGFELGARGAPLMAGGLIAPSPRMRSASFSGGGLGRPAGLIGGGGMGGLGNPAMAGAMMRSRSRSRDRAMIGAERMALEDARRKEAELARIRAERTRLEAEAHRRQRTASAMRAERAALAAANQAILASPRMSPAMLPLGVPGATALRRTHSWSGGIPGSPLIGGMHGLNLGGGGGLGHHHHHHASPRVVPVPVPVPVHTPHMHAHGLGGMGGMPLRARTPSPGRLLARTPSPRVVNYNTFNVSPRVGGLGGGFGGVGVGDLGALDDLALGGRGVVDPPLFGDGLFDGAGAGMGGMPGALGAGMDFVVTDEAIVPGRTIVQNLGLVEGLSSRAGAPAGLLSEDDRLNLAIADLQAQAQARGANGVLQVETGEDLGGEIVVRGRAVVLA